jgi:hypothetical protein
LPNCRPVRAGGEISPPLNRNAECTCLMSMPMLVSKPSNIDVREPSAEIPGRQIIKQQQILSFSFLLTDIAARLVFAIVNTPRNMTVLPISPANASRNASNSYAGENQLDAYAPDEKSAKLKLKRY